jgi:thiamine biosynthesis lipoprotein ApbE
VTRAIPLVVFVAALCVAGAAACRPARRGPTIARAWDVMGTVFTAAAWGPDSAALDHALERAAESIRVVDSLRASGRPVGAAVLHQARSVARTAGVRFDADSAAQGYALDRAALALAGVADSALLDLGGPILWIGTRPTRRRVGIADPENPLRTLAVVELTGGSALSTTVESERRGTRSVTVLAPSSLAADMWSTVLFSLGCDRALAVGAAGGVSVVCADSGRVRWTADLEGRVLPARGP